MVKVIPEELVINSSDIKTGQGKNGTWGMYVAKSEKGTDRITLWIDNIDAIESGDYAIDKILNVAFMPDKYTDKDGNEKWTKKCTMNVVLKKIEGGAGFSKISDEDIPF